MTPPDFDPFELLGVDASADAATIDRAYKSRIRHVHPDIAGIAGLDETKRLNIAREWLLDPALRAQLPKPPPRWSHGSARRTGPPGPPRPAARAAPGRRAHAVPTIGAAEGHVVVLGRRRRAASPALVGLRPGARRPAHVRLRRLDRPAAGLLRVGPLAHRR